MPEIYRKKVTTEIIEIPEEMVVCEYCKGAGLLSKYDEGWTSMMHDPDLAALRECPICHGRGFVQDLG